MTIRYRRAHGTVLAAFVGVLLAHPSASAQQVGHSGAGRPPRATVFVSIDYNAQIDDESNLGKGAGISGGVTYRLTRKVSAGVEVVRLAHRRELTYYYVPGHPSEGVVAVHSTLTGAATYVLGQVTYTFSTSRIQPFVSGQVGMMHYAGTPWTAMFPGPGHEPAARFRTTAGAGGLVGGAKVMLAGGFWAGPQVGLLLAGTGESGTKAALYGGVRAGYDW